MLCVGRRDDGKQGLAMKIDASVTDSKTSQVVFSLAPSTSEDGELMLDVDGARPLSAALDDGRPLLTLKIKHTEKAWSILTTAVDGLKI